MARIVIDEVNEHVISKLKDQITANHRSLEDEVRSILTAMVSRRRQLILFREFAKRVMDSTADTQETDNVDLIREDRSR